MEPFELLRIVADVCERLKIRYLTVGSLATIACGEPRFTNDIDVLLDLQPQHIDAFCQAFSASEYYLSRAAVESAVRKRFQFNIIHTTSALKVDCILPTDSTFDRSQLSRGVRKRVLKDFEAVFGSPEDMIIKKMEYFRLGESDKHLRDIAGVMRVSGDGIDRGYSRTGPVALACYKSGSPFFSDLSSPELRSSRFSSPARLLVTCPPSE